MDDLSVPFSLVRAGDSLRAHCIALRCYLPDPFDALGLRPYRVDVDLRTEASRTQAANAIVQAAPDLANQFTAVREAVHLLACGYDSAGPMDISAYVDLQEQDQASEPPAGFKIISAADLVRDQPRLKPVVIDGLLRRGEIMNVVAAPKTGKSWAVHDMALAVATGTAWFNFPCVSGRVLLIDNELHPQTLSMRLEKVALSRGLSFDHLHDRLDLVPLRGALKDIVQISELFAYLKGQQYALLIIDSLYRALPQGVDENSNVDITRIYNLLDQVADHTGAAIAVVHHTSKGMQSGKAITDVGAGAGAQARAADTHLTLRPHAEEGVVVLDAVVRSFKPIGPTCWRFDLPRFTPEPELNPTDLMTARRKKVVSGTNAAPVTWSAQLFAERILTDEPAIMEVVISAGHAYGLSERETRRLLMLTTAQGLAMKSGGVRGNPSRYCRTFKLPQL